MILGDRLIFFNFRINLAAKNSPIKITEIVSNNTYADLQDEFEILGLCVQLHPNVSLAMKSQLHEQKAHTLKKGHFQTA